MSVETVILYLLVSSIYVPLVPDLQRLESRTKLCSYLSSVPLFLSAGEREHVQFARVFILSQLLKVSLEVVSSGWGPACSSAVCFRAPPPTEAF